MYNYWPFVCKLSFVFDVPGRVCMQLKYYMGTMRNIICKNYFSLIKSICSINTKTNRFQHKTRRGSFLKQTKINENSKAII